MVVIQLLAVSLNFTILTWVRFRSIDPLHEKQFLLIKKKRGDQEETKHVYVKKKNASIRTCELLGGADCEATSKQRSVSYFLKACSILGIQPPTTSSLQYRSTRAHLTTQPDS